MKAVVRLVLGAAALAAAGPAFASRNLEGLVVDTFYNRCVTPLLAGDAPDIDGLPDPADATQIGTPGHEILFENVDGPMNLRIRTLADGLHTCILSLKLEGDFATEQVAGALESRLTDKGFTRIASCADGHDVYATGPQGAVGTYLTVMSYSIRPGAVRPDQFGLIAAESADAPDASSICLQATGVQP